ncbi:Cell morphoproteinsis protein PAG1 [Saitoella coloradoensis]
MSALVHTRDKSEAQPGLHQRQHSLPLHGTSVRSSVATAPQYPLPPSETRDNDTVVTPTTPTLTSPSTLSTPNSSPQRNAAANHRHLHHRQHSQTDVKTPAEYALHILFTQFVRLSERKLHQILSYPADTEPDITALVGAGADPAFDKVLAGLGFVARHRPKPVIDSVMFWRKSKNEAASASVQTIGPSAQQGPDAQRQRAGTMTGNQTASSLLPSQNVILANRRSLVSIYILCRVLIEVIKQTTAEKLGADLGDKLEEIVFTQLKTTDPEMIATSPIQLANWTLFAELLGCMSEIRFGSVSDRFIADLEKYAKTVVMKEEVAKVETVIHGMRFFKIKIYPMEDLEESAAYLASLAKFFANSEGSRIKHAYADLLTRLLLPIAGSATAEVNYPAWAEAVEMIYPKALKLTKKTKDWSAGFLLACSVLCVSPREFFQEHWFGLIEANLKFLKDKTFRTIMLECIVRLTWVYVFRCPETLNSTVKKLEFISKTLFPAGRRNMIPSDTSVEPFVQIIRFMAARHQDMALRNTIFPLINGDQLAAPNAHLTFEAIGPERTAVAIKAYMLILNDLQNSGATPPFPESFNVQSEAAKSDAIKATLLSTPALRTFHDLFCNVQYRSAVFCDAYFGNAAAVEERALPRTPIAASFHNAFVDTSAAAISQTRDKQAYFDLLRTLFDALPRCLSSSGNYAKTIEILCRGTFHVDAAVASAARRALVRVAQATNAQLIATSYARFLFKYDETRSANAKALEGECTESSLKLYVRLLGVWLEALRAVNVAKDVNANSPAAVDGAMPSTPSTDDTARSDGMGMTNVWTLIEETESHGLFFLCSQSRMVRRYAIQILRLILEFDEALGATNDASSPTMQHSPATPQTPSLGAFNRVIDLMDRGSSFILQFNREMLSVAEQSRLHKFQHGKAKDGILVKLAEGDNGIDTALWLRAFPRLIQECFQRLPMATVLCRNSVCTRLRSMQDMIVRNSQLLRHPTAGLFDLLPKHTRETTSSEGQIEQWKLYLVVACATLTLTDEQVQSKKPSVMGHWRQRSSNSSPPSYDKIISARALFELIAPLLKAENVAIRDAVVTGFGCINVNLYRVLTEVLSSQVQKTLHPLEDARKGYSSRTHMATRRDKTRDRMRTEVTHIFQLTSHFLQDANVLKDVTILRALFDFSRDMKAFLEEPEIQVDWEYQRLRRYFCNLMESLYEGILKTPEPSEWFPFDGRLSCFRLVEEWCGLGQYGALARQRDERMRATILEQNRAVRDRGALMTSVEIEKGNVEYAALNCMATLCAGPILPEAGSDRMVISFDVSALYRWIDAVLANSSERVSKIGCRALSNLLEHNRMHPILLRHSIQQCYSGDPSLKSTQSYFNVISEVLCKDAEYPCEGQQLIALCLLKIGDRDIHVRRNAMKLMKHAEERFYGKSCVKEYETSILSQTPAVFKRAQYLLSTRLAADHAEASIFVFSEFTLAFKLVVERTRRDLVEVLLPWLQNLQLPVDEGSGDLSPSACVVVVNLLEITVKYGAYMQNEIEALWTALASGPYPSNVMAILDFLMKRCFEARDPTLVLYAKQVVLYVGRTTAGAHMVDTLIGYFQPRSMIPQAREPSLFPPTDIVYPYVASISDIFPAPSKPVVFSQGQLALIFIIDLMSEPFETVASHIPILLHLVFVQLDHYTSIVHEQAKLLLIQLIDTFVLAKQSDFSQSVVTEFIEDLRERDVKSLWTYDEMNHHRRSARTPKQMEHLVRDVLAMFSPVFPELRQLWGKRALSWATSCPVRHLACRSFQVFRCLMSPMDQGMLADMLARLSNTIADNSTDIQGFAMEILTTIAAITAEMDIGGLTALPQLFWVTVACLNSIHEQEFLEALSILDNIMAKLDLGLDANVHFLIACFPPKWEGKFEGLQPLILKGLKSSTSYNQTIKLLDKLCRLPSNEIVGVGESRLLFALLANVPRFINAIEQTAITEDISLAASRLGELADEAQLRSLSRILVSFANSRFKSKEDFVRQLISSLKEVFFPAWEGQSLIFLLGLLHNRSRWVKMKTLEVLKKLLSFIDMRKPEFAGVGADLISPLLRLVQTEYAQHALEVLDEAAAISGGPLDKHVLRMSLGNRTIRKEYEKTATLFGIPDDNGWAVPMPAITSSATRNNVHAVFYTCSISSNNVGEPASDIKFHAEDYAYIGADERTETMMSDDRGDGTLGDMVSALHSLDVFFTEDVSSEAQKTPTITDTEFNTEPAPQNVYDTRVAAILSRSLQRTPSVSSFRTAFVAGGPSTANSRDRGYGGPSFTGPSSFSLLRPSMAPRNISSQSLGVLSSSSGEDFDDDDDDRGGGSGFNKSFRLEY